jgi:hypothetical protein
MLLREKTPGAVRPAIVRHLTLRIGLYVGFALSVMLTTWIFLANRVAFLEPFDRERDLIATTVIGLFALIPVMRYVNAPRSLLLCGMAAWTILSFTYRLLCLDFPQLYNILTPTQVLAMGMLFYLISATVAWMVAVIWRVRQSDSSHSHVNR